MKTKIITLWAFILILAQGTYAQEFTSINEASRKALNLPANATLVIDKKNNPSAVLPNPDGASDIVLLIHGSNWHTGGEVFKKNVWDKSIVSSDLQNVVYAAIDFKETFDSAENNKFFKDNNVFWTKWDDQNQRVEFIHNYPALIYCDAHGRPINWIRGIGADTSKEFVMTKLKQFAAERARRDSLINKSKTETGLKKAELLGKSIETLPTRILRSYAGLINEIKGHDQDDELGYFLRYKFNIEYMIAHKVKRLTSSQKYQEALEYTKSLLAKKVITEEQRQQIMCFEYTIYNNWPAHIKDEVNALKKVIAFNPDSVTGKAAQTILGGMQFIIEMSPVTEGLLVAVQNNDVAEFIKHGKKLSTILPDKRFKKRMAPVPKHTTYGKLLSDESLLSVSSSSQWDEPWSHYFIVSGKHMGLLHTGGEPNAWAKVELLKERTIKGIVIVNRPSYGMRLIPAKVAISKDGKTWTDVYSITKDKRIYEIPIDNQVARFVKIYKDDNKTQHLHVCNILVYGE